MTPRVAGLGDMPAITAGFRPFRPAPTAAGPGDPPPGTPAGPWHPRHDDDPGLTRLAPNANRQRLTELLDDIERLLDGPDAA